MALALAATVEPERLNARLDVSGIPAGAAKISITRQSPSGAVAGVRGAVGAAVSGTSYIARDWELPLDLSVTYTATVYNAGGTALGSATAILRIPYSACEAWLVDLARPTNSLPLVIESMEELTFGLPTGIHRVLNRRDPVVTALAAWTPETELVVLTDTLEERDRVRDLLGTGYPFLLRTAPGLGVGNAYFALSEFVEERFLTLGTAPERRFRVACVQVERPDPAVYVPVAPNTYANVKASFASYSALKAAVASYDALAYVFPPGVADPVIPWPPSDV